MNQETVMRLEWSSFVLVVIFCVFVWIRMLYRLRQKIDREKRVKAERSKDQWRPEVLIPEAEAQHRPEVWVPRAEYVFSPEMKAAMKARKAAEKTARRKEQYASDPSYRLRIDSRRLIRDELKKGNSTVGPAEKLLGCTIDEARNHIASQFQDGMTWENWSQYGWHLDHIKSLASFNLEDPKQLAAAYHYTNLQPLWWQDNLKKG